MKKLTLLLTVLFVLTASMASAATIKLAWDKSSGDVEGYRIYWGVEAENYTKNKELPNILETEIEGFREGQTYYFVVRAFNIAGESGNSNMVTYSVPEIIPEPTVPDPPNLKVPEIIVPDGFIIKSMKVSMTIEAEDKKKTTTTTTTVVEE